MCFLVQPMLDVPIYGRIATLELFRPHVSCHFYSPKSYTVRALILVVVWFYLMFCVHIRVKHRIFYLLQQKDTNSVFFSGMRSHLSSLQGSSIKKNKNKRRVTISFHPLISRCLTLFKLMLKRDILTMAKNWDSWQLWEIWSLI